jgi:Lamin Tail Domain
MSKVILLALVTALLLLPGTAHGSASGVVVSQVYGGGGNAGATYRNDFVELFNAGSAAVDLSGWTVQYATAAGTTWQATALTGTIAPGRYYLVQLASNADVGAVLPSADATGTSNLGGTSGKIALVRGTAELTCGASAGSCSASGLLEDFVGYGSASDFEGAGSADGLTNTSAALRADNGCTDTGNNATDFAAGPPAPRNSASPARPCGGTPSPGPSGSVNVGLDVASVLSVSLDRASLDFGTFTAGDRPAPLPERVTVSSNNATGYSLVVARTAFTPNDLPLALSATAPAGGTLGGALSGGALAAIPVTPSTPLTVGTRTAPSAAGGDVWATNIGFASVLPLVATGHYTATVTFSAVAR